MPHGFPITLQTQLISSCLTRTNAIEATGQGAADVHQAGRFVTIRSWPCNSGSGQADDTVSILGLSV